MDSDHHTRVRACLTGRLREYSEKTDIAEYHPSHDLRAARLDPRRAVSCGTVGSGKEYRKRSGPLQMLRTISAIRVFQESENQAMVQPGPTTGQRTRRYWPQSRAGGCLLIATIILGPPLIVFIFSAIAGQVTGYEFSPDKIARRRFAYIEIPFLHLQITPLVRSDETEVLEVHLQNSPFIPKSKAKKRREVSARPSVPSTA